MRNIIYDVAASLDGFIAAPGDDISAFPMEGEHVAAYQQRLAGYDTVIMGRRTYEFGYTFGLKPGMRAYPHMQHVIFSKGIKLPQKSDVEVAPQNWLKTIDSLKAATGTDIYLCGGGAFAGYLLANGCIDRLIVKLAPIVLGSGIQLFGDIANQATLEPVKIDKYDNGVILLEYQLNSSGRNTS
ncbi:MAG: dihydrofolate reductase family protein [Hyphomicrobiales bacterium]